MNSVECLFTGKGSSTDPKIDFYNIINNAFKAGYSFAAWRMPGQRAIKLVSDDEPVALYDHPEIETLDSGFIIHPFEINSEHCAYNIRAQFSLVFTDKDCNWQFDTQLGAHKIQQITEDLITPFQPIESSIQYLNDIVDTQTEEKDHYIQLVKSCIEQIESGSYRKIVPSRCRQVKSKTPIDALATFMEACKKYPLAFVSLVCLPNREIWIGATPEHLIGIDADNTFFTTSLAGTQLHQKDVNLSDIAWKQKEIEEQALVSRFIIDCFK
ncbi:MAG: chorismate-binding protein, partial [Cyclobacteriaceae bacterium]